MRAPSKISKCHSPSFRSHQTLPLKTNNERLKELKEPLLKLTMHHLISQSSSLNFTDMCTDNKKSRNGDTLGPVELNVRLEQSNQGDRCEQDDQGEVSIIIFGMSESSGFQKYSISWVFQALFLCLCLCRCLCHCLCLCICVL